MILPVVLLSAAVYLAEALLTEKLLSGGVDNVAVEERAAPGGKTPELTLVSMYWTAFAKRRAEAMDRCDSRLFRYSSRRKQAQELLINVARRNAAAELFDIRLSQEGARKSEADLVACVQQIVNLHGDDAFYSEYQNASTELERLTDQVASCEEVGGRVSRQKRQADVPFDEQAVASVYPKMYRVYKDTLRQITVKKAEKSSCFESLVIPANLPVQLESVSA